jgi:hypothetical protein
VLLGYRQGSFQLRRTLVARRYLLAAQLGLFVGRGQWGDVAKAVLLAAAKTGIDLFAAIPGGALFFMRMSDPASATAIEELKRCLKPDDGCRHRV